MKVDENYLFELYKDRFAVTAEEEYNKFLCDYLLRYLPLQAKPKVLEIGFGNGMFLKELEKRGFETYGMDISKKLVELVSKFVNGELKVGDINKPLPYKSNFFDAVVLFAVLEYAKDYNKSLKEINRVLKNNGIVFIIVLNSNSILHKILRKKWSYYQDVYHASMFDKKSLSRALQDAGFKIIDIKTGFNFYLAGTTTKIFKFFRCFKKVIFVPQFGDEIFCIARKNLLLIKK